MAVQTQAKPTGVTILVGLEVLAGIAALAMSLYLLTLPYFPGKAFTFFTAFGLVNFLLAYGLWKGRSWAWTVTLVLSTLGIVFWLANIFELITISPSTFWGSIINIVIYVTIIFYLTRPQVKAFFE